MNYTWIAGHLGSEPETRFTPSGKKVVSLRVACKSRKGGKEETMWWKVTIWGDTFDKILPYFKKGSPIVVCGEMTPPEIYQNREGGTQVSLGITANHISFSPFGKGKSNEEGPSGQAQNFSNSYSQESAVYQGASGPDFISDEEIPF